jgi:hypothetical protein
MSMVVPEFAFSWAILCIGFLVISVFLIQCQILLSSCDVDWGWRAIIGSIIEWIYFTLEKSCRFLPRGPVCRESLCSTTIGRNYCVVSLSSFSLAEAQSKHLMDLFQFSIVLSDFITTICLNFEGHKKISCSIFSALSDNNTTFHYLPHICFLTE